jgi:hypothetical protein
VSKNTAKKMPDMAILDALFLLDRDRGVLIRKRTWTNHKAGEVCGTKMHSGHLQTHVDGRRYLVHRLVYFMATGVDPMEMRVDHINGIPYDNRPENIRLATQANNGSHKVKLATTNTSGYRNVSWSSRWKVWIVSLTVAGKRVARRFKDKDEAIAAARSMRAEYYGEFAGITL